MFLGTELYGECIGLSRVKEGVLTVWELRRDSANNRLEIREYKLGDFPQKPYLVDSHGDPADTRQRPWYAKAKDERRQVWSHAYPFLGVQGVAAIPGVTCATPLFDAGDKLVGVLGIDFQLGQLCDFLQTLRVGQAGFAFVVEILPDGQRRIIAHPERCVLFHEAADSQNTFGSHLVAPDEVADLRVKAFMAEVPTTLDLDILAGVRSTRFSQGGVSYLGAYRMIDGPGLPRWLICTAIPEEEVMDRAWANSRLAILIGAIVLSAATLISLFVSGQFSRSLVKLVQEMESIGEFRLEPRASVASVLVEVDRLARATEQMKSSLRSFGKYVPAGLVRKLIASGVGSSARRRGSRSDHFLLRFGQLHDHFGRPRPAKTG